MPRVFVADSRGVVSLRRMSRRTFDRKYMSAGRHYVYRKARFRYDALENRFYWVGAKRKNRRFGHKSEIFVRIEQPQQRKAIPVQFDTYFYPANQADQPSPFPELHRTFWVTIKAKAWKYEHHDFGEYPEAWRVGLLSDILHSIMYNRGKGMTEGEWKLWRIPEYENKVDVRLPEKRKKGVKVIQSFVGLVQEIEDAFEKELGGGE